MSVCIVDFCEYSCTSPERPSQTKCNLFTWTVSKKSLELEQSSVSQFTNNDDGTYELTLTCFMKIFSTVSDWTKSALQVTLDPIKKKVQADCGSSQKKIESKGKSTPQLTWKVSDVKELKELQVSDYFTIPQSPTCVFQIWVRKKDGNDRSAVPYITTTLLSAVPADGDTSNLKMDIATEAAMTNQQWPGNEG